MATLGLRLRNNFRASFWAVLVLCALLAFVLPGCGKGDNTAKDSDTEADASVPTNVKTGVKPEPDAQVAVIETNDYGRIVIEMYPNIAPKMVERFKKLINEHFYDGTTFHRIDPQLGIIQGGYPLSKDNEPANDGTGDSPYPNVPGELSDI